MSFWIDVPVLSAAREYVQAGISPGGTHANHRFLADWVTYAADVTKEEQLILCDAQTSGGLLAAVAPDQADALVASLASAGHCGGRGDWPDRIDNPKPDFRRSLAANTEHLTAAHERHGLPQLFAESKIPCVRSAIERRP